MKRLAILLGCLAVSVPTLADAGCSKRVLNDTEQSFANAALHRLKPIGVSDLDKIGHAGANNELDHWMIMGMRSSVFMHTQDEMLDEIGIVLSNPASKAEQQKEILFAAFTMARLSGNSEPAIEDQLHASVLAHTAPGEWIEKSGSAIAAFTRTDSGLVIKMGKLDCQ